MRIGGSYYTVTSFQQVVVEVICISSSHAATTCHLMRVAVASYQYQIISSDQRGLEMSKPRMRRSEDTMTTF